MSWRPWGHREVRRRWRPTARCKPDKKRRYMSKKWTYSWQLCFLKKHSQFSHSGSSANHWTSGQKTHLIRNGKKSNFVPFVVPGLPASSSSTIPSPSSPSSSSQDSVFDVNRYSENPVPERSGSTSEEVGRDPLHKPTETETKIKMRNAKKYTAIYCMTWRTGCRSSDKIWSMKVVL